MEAPSPSLWIESEGEAAQIGRFLDLRLFQHIYVGKSGRRRDVGDAYLAGRFREYDITEREVTDIIVAASPAITNLVQLGIPDIIVSNGETPLAAIELTSHKPTYNNLFQRFPKLYRPAACGVPSYIFQLHEPGEMEPLKSQLVAAADRATRFTRNPCIVYFYEDHETDNMHNTIGRLVNAHLAGDVRWIEQFYNRVRQRNAAWLAAFPTIKFGGNFFEVRPDRVIAHMRVVRNCDALPGIICGINHCESGAARQQTAKQIRDGTHLARLNNGDPVKCVWITKGTGGLDPYPGYLLAGKLLLCTDTNGSQTKPLVAKFEHVPRDFWWWDTARTRLNNRMLLEIADTLLYEGERA